TGLRGPSLGDPADDLARKRRANLRPVARLDTLASYEKGMVSRRRRHGRTLILTRDPSAKAPSGGARRLGRLDRAPVRALWDPDQARPALPRARARHGGVLARRQARAPRLAAPRRRDPPVRRSARR